MSRCMTQSACATQGSPWCDPRLTGQGPRPCTTGHATRLPGRALRGTWMCVLSLERAAACGPGRGAVAGGRGGGQAAAGGRVDTDDNGGTVQVERDWGSLVEAAARSSDGVAKVRWLLQRRGGQLQVSQWECMAVEAANAVCVEMVEHALSLRRPAGDFPLGLTHAAGQSGSIPLVQSLRHAGVVIDFWAYLRAAEAGSLALVQWLVYEAGVSAEGQDLSFVLARWPRGPSAATSRELLQMVQLLVEKVGWRGWEGTSELVAVAARRGDLALVQYLLQHQPARVPAGLWCGVGGG